MATPVPVIIIGGFLGAGKTTLLNHILSENHGVRAGVLVNDFGAINIDAKLVVGVHGDAINLENGCVCCNIRDDLIGACMSLIQGENPPNILLIEASGVSEPAQIANSFVSPDIARVLPLNAIFTLVDTDQVLGLGGEMAHLAMAQIRAADLLVLNKVDLASRETITDVKQLVAKVAPGTRTIEAVNGQVPLGIILNSYHGDLTTGHVHSDHHHVHDHADTFDKWHWTCDKKLSLPKVQAVLHNLPETIYRAKGLFYIEELPVFKVLMQHVGTRFSLNETDRWGAETPRSEIVMIAERGGIDTDAMQRAFDGCVGTGSDENSPVLRLMKKIAPEYLDENVRV